MVCFTSSLLRSSRAVFDNSPFACAGNSSKNHRNQPLVAAAIADQLRAGETGIVGVMIESNLHEGNQKVPIEGPEALRKGVSITDACIGWDTTVEVLENLAEAVRARRKLKERETNGVDGH